MHPDMIAASAVGFLCWFTLTGIRRLGYAALVAGIYLWMNFHIWLN